MELNEIVRRVRENRSLTQQNVAEEIGVNVSTINRYESSGAKIPVGKLEDIAKALKTTVSDLYAYKENPALLEEPLQFFYKNARKQVSITVQLDGTTETLNEWFSTLKKINSAIA
jgi:transcriptional regulator with XRE-family HTH domain